MGTTRRQEWTWVMVMAGLIVAASTLPYLAGHLAQTPEWHFGGAVMDQQDYHSHLAKMWQGYRGAWRYRLLFTPESHEGVFLQAFYLGLGHIARLSGLGLALTYQVSRVTFGFLMLLAIYRFVSLFVPTVRTRRLAFLLASIASGLGWLTETLAPTGPSGVSPMDFWLLDAYTYLSLLTMPHFCAAIGLLLSIFVLLLKRAEGPNLWEGALAVLASVALGMIHPYDLLLADALPLLYWGIEAVRIRYVNWRGVLTVTAMAIVQTPLLAYDLWVFRTQPAFAGWEAQSLTPSPPWPVYLWGYGLLLLLGAVGVLTWVRRGWRGLAFPVLWVGLAAVLVYLPWNLQRRLLEGVQVPLGLLAGVGLAEGLLPVTEGQDPGRFRWLAVALVIVFAAISNLYLTASYTLAAVARDTGLFWPAEVLAGIDWLGNNLDPEDRVLSSYQVGNLIPARIGQQVVLGHDHETTEYKEKAAKVTRFFAAATPHEERVALLKRYGVAYVFFSPYEQALGPFEPEESDYLVEVFAHDDVYVFEVKLP